ncbi:hypothetical protein BDZ97DRAFT_1916295 [Flammula alnicola]|nr:hypothetical protein BDZ97DRAFT_1916295 [Flammula alnicola]
MSTPVQSRSLHLRLLEIIWALETLLHELRPHLLDHDSARSNDGSQRTTIPEYLPPTSQGSVAMMNGRLEATANALHLYPVVDDDLADAIIGHSQYFEEVPIQIVTSNSIQARNDLSRNALDLPPGRLQFWPASRSPSPAPSGLSAPPPSPAYVGDAMH